VRYIDTGSRGGTRSATDAVGSWLGSILATNDVSALRLQSGYIRPEPLGFLEPALKDLAARDGETTILLGSNGGETARATVEDVLNLAGPHRAHLRLGVASFSDGLFHPKVYHMIRDDGSMVAYVGSANFTYAGISGKNVEAGITLDTRDGDDPSVLTQIASSIDAWFQGPQTGLFVIRSAADLPQLVADGILDASRPKGPAKPRRKPAASAGAVLTALGGLLRMPAISKKMKLPPAAPSPATTSPIGTKPNTPAFVDWWMKELSASDAQRKPSGNQSGVIAFTKAMRKQIDQTTYFRNHLFGGLVWQQSPTRTGHMMDVAQVDIHTTVLGKYLGILTYEVSHDNVREARQRNYTAKLSLAPIRAEFARTDMTKKIVEIGRDSAGDYWLEIS